MSKKLWGGRFKKKTDKAFEAFSRSVQFDYKLAEYDVFHSQIHVLALKAARILTATEAGRLMKVLDGILLDISRGRFKPDGDCEDIHSDIQNRVHKKAGKLSEKLHTLRSRNDQVAFDQQWYCLVQNARVEKMLLKVINSLNLLAEKYEYQEFIGYTHLQRAQVIRFTDYLFAWQRMFEKDAGRLGRYGHNLFAYLGAGALAGTALPRECYKKALKQFMKRKGWKPKKTFLVENSVAQVSDRDFVIEFLSILAIVQTHLSRLAEDFILYAGKEFDFFDLPEEFCTGSSLMPHKKNPDFLELMRGATGKVYGNLTAILTVMKGLPLAYNRDMQHDKEPLFSSVETVKEELQILERFLPKVKLKTKNIEKALEDESLYATEIAEFLVMEKKVPFAQAHDIVGRLIRYAEVHRMKIRHIPVRILRTFHPGLEPCALEKIMRPEAAVSSKRSIPHRLPKLKKIKD